MRLRAGVVYVQDRRCAEPRERKEVGIRLRTGWTCAGSVRRGRPGLERIERFAFEKGKMRGGGTAPSGQNQAEKPRFFAKRQAVWFETRSVSSKEKRQAGSLSLFFKV